MSDPYYLDLNQITLDQFQQHLAVQELLPGRKILGEDIAGRFAVLAGMGLNTLQDVRQALSTKDKLARFAQESGLPTNYLTILRREVNSYRPKPVSLQAFPGVDEVCLLRLETADIKSSHRLFNQARTTGEVSSLAQQLELEPAALSELAALCDLVRILGVGPVSARLLYDANVRSCSAVSEADAGPLYDRLMVLNQEAGYTKALFQEKDVADWIQFARMLPGVGQ